MTYATNTILMLPMILGRALRLVGRATPEDAQPFDVVAEFDFPTSHLAMTIDGFTDEVLTPALDVAMTHKQPKGTIKPFVEARPHQDMEATAAWEERGIFGRIVRQYDVNNDVMLARAEILYRGVKDASS